MNPFESASLLEDAAPLDRVATPIRDLTHRLLGSSTLRNLLHGVWLGHPLHPVLVQVPR